MTSALLAGSLTVGGTALLCYAMMKLARRPGRGSGNSGSDGNSIGTSDGGFGWSGGDACRSADSSGSCDGGGDGGGGD